MGPERDQNPGKFKQDKALAAKRKRWDTSSFSELESESGEDDDFQVSRRETSTLDLRQSQASGPNSDFGTLRVGEGNSPAIPLVQANNGEHGVYSPSEAGDSDSSSSSGSDFEV